MKRVLLYLCMLTATMTLLSETAKADWQMKPVTIKTRWADKVTPTNVLPEYPRPQLVRVSAVSSAASKGFNDTTSGTADVMPMATDMAGGIDAWRTRFMEKGSAEAGWLNLNGVWDFTQTSSLWSALPTNGWQEILVPFCTESALSGIKQQIRNMAYRRTFTVPTSWSGKRVKLNFGAVDWKCSVWVDGDSVGAHQGGYDPFSLDITSKVKPGTEQTLVVRVYDPSDADSNPRGKQVSRPGGIFYTSCSGIWQTVWMEAVATTYISDLRIIPDVDKEQITVTVTARGDNAANANVQLKALHGATEVSQVEGSAGTPLVLPISKPDLWSPDHPFLYDLQITLTDDQGNTDQVISYFGMRKVNLAPWGTNRWQIHLNNKFLFHMGCLDQGYWPESNLTPPSEAALLNDIVTMKKIGLNMVRKHITVEPLRWYYWCDRLGLMVWQDMPGMNYGGSYKDIPNNSAYFTQELLAMLDNLKNVPSIVTWVLFNEAGGQHETASYVNLVKNYDETRLVDEASGWTLYGNGDIKDIHSYPAPSYSSSETQATAVGEYGGVQMAIDGHMWSSKGGVYGYVDNAAQYDSTYAAYTEMLFQSKVKSGLSAAVYTQITDVESELNGIMTYDRLFKTDTMNLYRANRHVIEDYGDDYLYVMPSADVLPTTWRYTTTEPEEGWDTQSDFDDSKWKIGKSGFGMPGFDNMVVNTRWNSGDIWLRCHLPLNITEEQLKKLRLKLYHDEDCQIYVNGTRIVNVSGYTQAYTTLQLPANVRTAFNPQGDNTIAVHVKQTTGGQFFDMGLFIFGEKNDIKTHQLKLNLDYTKSSEVSLVVGYATATDATTPDVSYTIDKLPIDHVSIGLNDDMLLQPTTLTYDLTPYFKDVDPERPVKYFVYVNTTLGQGTGTIHSATLTDYTVDAAGQEIPLLQGDTALAANQSILLTHTRGKYTILQDRLQKLVAKCDPQYIIFTTPLLDTEAPYVDGSECGPVTTEALVEALGQAVEAGKQAIEQEEDRNEVLQPLCDAIEDAYNKCMEKNNPLQDDAYYYVLSGFAADAKTAGTALGITYASADNYVYKSPLMPGNTAYIFHLTRNSDYWHLQNVGNGLYLSTLERNNHVWSAEPVDLKIANRYENNLTYWTNDANDNIRKRLAFDITSADGKTHLMGPAGQDNKLTKGTTWWFCAWMFRPVDYVPAAFCDVNGDGHVDSADVVTIYDYIITGPKSGVGLTSADTDSNSHVNSADVVTVYNHIINH